MSKVKYVIAVLVIIVATGCETKQEAARSNLTNTWRIDSVTRDGADDTAAHTANRDDYTISFDEEGGFIESYIFIGGSDPTVINGSWTINSNASVLNLETNFTSRSYAIDLLDDFNLNITDQGETDDVKIFFVPD